MSEQTKKTPSHRVTVVVVLDVKADTQRAACEDAERLVAYRMSASKVHHIEWTGVESLPLEGADDE